MDNSINSICFSSDGKYMATGSDFSMYGEVVLWSINQLGIVKCFKGH